VLVTELGSWGKPGPRGHSYFVGRLLLVQGWTSFSARVREATT
jgi:hypothetical protein